MRRVYDLSYFYGKVLGIFTVMIFFLLEKLRVRSWVLSRGPHCQGCTHQGAGDG